MTLDVPLRELDTQRLHQGLSETILVNTLTDFREFKNKSTDYISHLLRTSFKVQKGHTKVNVELVQDFDEENTTNHKSIEAVF